jgi:hypothetical protein
MRRGSPFGGILEHRRPRPWRCTMPLQDFFWTAFFVFALGVTIWLLVVVLRDLFARADLSGGARVAWTLAACLLPLVGSLVYLVTRGADAGELRMGVSGKRSDASIYR